MQSNIPKATEFNVLTNLTCFDDTSSFRSFQEDIVETSKGINELFLLAESCLTRCNTDNLTSLTQNDSNCPPTDSSTLRPSSGKLDVILPACLTVLFILSVTAVTVALIRKRKMAMIQRARKKENEKLKDIQPDRINPYKARPLPRPVSGQSYLELMSASTGNSVYMAMAGTSKDPQATTEKDHYLTPIEIVTGDEPIYHEVHNYYEISPYLKMDQFKQK